jgi:hypothetical protein
VCPRLLPPLREATGSIDRPSSQSDRVSDGLEQAANFLTTVTARQFLEGLFPRGSTADEVLELAPRLDHVGFMAPSLADSELGSAAEEAGFDPDWHTYPSTIFARELAWLLGRDSVATTIFRAHRKSTDGTPLMVEVLIPRDVDSEVVGDWIRRDIGTHVALEISSIEHFDPLERILNREGLRMSSFMDGTAIRNEAAGVTSAFFDVPSGEYPPHIEFCHYD